jgi:hypothetical protein
MKISCDIISDLLPLYYDDVCSLQSRELIEEHLGECEQCRSMLSQFEQSTIEDNLLQERDDIIERHAQKIKQQFLLTGVRTASVVMIPVLVQLIVHLVTGYAFDWLFIALATLITLISMKIVPFVFEEGNEPFKLKRFSVSFVLLLLTLAASLRGEVLFFAVVPLLIGLLVILMLYLLKRKELSRFEKRRGWLITLIMDGVLVYVIVVSIRFYGMNFNWWAGCLLMLVCLMLPWIVFSAVRQIKADVFMRTGVYIIFGGLFLSLIESVSFWLTRGVIRFAFLGANLTIWNNDVIASANIFLLSILVCAVVGGGLIGVGLVRKK